VAAAHGRPEWAAAWQAVLEVFYDQRVANTLLEREIDDALNPFTIIGPVETL
jgi:hypothetical protein